MNTSYNTKSRNLTRLQQEEPVFHKRIINKWNSLSHEVATSSNVLQVLRLMYISFLYNEQVLHVYFYGDRFLQV